MRMIALILALLAFASMPPAATAAGDGVRADPLETILSHPAPKDRQLAQSCGMGYSVCMDECRGRYDACKVVQNDNVCMPRFRDCTGGCRRRHC